jgi:predicted amidohydrolase YtcJ
MFPVTVPGRQDTDSMLLIKNVELDAYKGSPYKADVRCRDGLIVEIGTSLLLHPGEIVIEGKGAALIPGLHDHHLHLLAMAAANTSVICGSPAVNNHRELQQVLKKSIHSPWIRGIQYHESVAGDLDRWQLDQWVSDRPVRIQHRSGILWILNSCAIEQLQLENEHLEGLERNAQNQVTGRLFRLDQWLRGKIGRHDTPDLSDISIELARLGITGITDASANNNEDTLALFESALGQGQLHQRVVMRGNETLPESTHPKIHRGALKILLDEFQLPDWKNLQNMIIKSHQKNRAVAFHCVTEAQLVFALTALEEAGYFFGDRIEHASLCPDEIIPLLKSSKVAVVTQPGFLHSRGSQYQHEVPKSAHDSLYRCQSFLQQGIPLAFSSDAPYGDINPWRNMNAAITRANSSGYIFGKKETLTAEQALLAYLKDPVDLSVSREISTGADADLCLLKKPWAESRNLSDNDPVQYTLCSGEIVYNP